MYRRVMIEKMCMKSMVLDVLSKFLSHLVTYNEMCDILDNIQVEIYNRRKVNLYIEDIFLSSLIPWVTTIPEQAYTVSELGKAVDALNGQASISYASFARVLPSMLTDDDRALLKIAHACVEENSSDDFLTENDKLLFSSIQNKYGNQRMEFYRFTTVTEWISYQLISLIRIRIAASKHAWAHFGASINEIKQKIQRYIFMLEGKEAMYIITDGTLVSVI